MAPSLHDTLSGLRRESGIQRMQLRRTIKRIDVH
jgi:hypothetical protein